MILLGTSLMGIVTSVQMWRCIHNKFWVLAVYFAALTAFWAFLIYSQIYN